MEAEKLAILGFISFLMSILSGIGGGGGGFIMTPLAIFFGLTPQQAIASGKIGGLGVALGSLQGLTKAKVHRWRVVMPLMLLAAIVGLIAPRVIVNLDNDLYRRLIGIMLLLLIPVMWLRKIGLHETTPSGWQKAIGIPLLAITLLMQAVFSSGMGTLVVLVLMGLLGMRALEANVTKRFSQVLLNSLVVLGLLGTGLIIWEVAIVLFIASVFGGYIGSKIAIKKGDEFITKIFAILMLISGLELIFG